MSDHERITAVEWRLALLEARLVALETRVPNLTMQGPAPFGWRCASCGLWIQHNTLHVCGQPFSCGY